MTKLAVIPARRGSKRIPGKNKRSFLGKPVILYSIDLALRPGLFDEVIVFSDDDEIVSLARQSGVKCPYRRTEKNADDHATLSDVLGEVLNNYAKDGIYFDHVCIILPAAPLIDVAKITDAFSLMTQNDYSSVIPVVRFSYPVQRALQMDAKQRLSFVSPEYEFTRSQDITPAFHDAGQFYWLKTSDFLREKSIFMKHTGAIELREYEVQDIDNETDWKLAEMKYRLLYDGSDEA